jgi:hypothetical protein
MSCSLARPRAREHWALPMRLHNATAMPTHSTTSKQRLRAVREYLPRVKVGGIAEGLAEGAADTPPMQRMINHQPTPMDGRALSAIPATCPMRPVTGNAGPDFPPLIPGNWAEDVDCTNGICPQRATPEIAACFPRSDSSPEWVVR